MPEDSPSVEMQIQTNERDLASALRELHLWKLRAEGAMQASGQVLREWNTSTDESIYSGALEAMLGIYPYELSGTFETWISLIHPDDRPQYRREINRVLVEGGPFDAEYRARKVNGHFTLLQELGYFITPFQGSSRVLSSVIKDISQQREMEFRLRNAQRVEAFSKLTGGVAHDFNNMLSVIIGYAQIMQEDFESDDENRLFLSEIEKAAIRASSLTNQLLAFSKPPEIKRSILQVNDVLVEIGKMLRRLLGDQIELLVEPTAILPMVQVDRSQIEQAFINLAVGARSTMAGGGKILITTKKFTLRKALLRDGHSLTPGTYAHICFIQFPNTPEASSSNTGCGTALSVIEQNEGRLFMRQIQSGDSRIDIYFPAYQESPAPGAPHSTKKQQKKSVVLLVEDDTAMRRFARTVLQRIGHTVLSASNGEEALKVLDEHPKVKPDLLLSDMVMPRMGGLVLAQKLTKKFPNMAILLVSGDPDQQPLAQQSQLDFSFLRKPFATGDLISKVGSLLHS